MANIIGTSIPLSSILVRYPVPVVNTDTLGNPQLFSFDGSGNLKVTGAGGGGSNPAAGSTGAAVPGFADYIGFNVGGNLIGVSAANPLPVSVSGLSAVTANQGTAAGLGGAWPVEITDGANVLGTAGHPVRIDPTGTTPQPVSGTVAVTQSTSPWVTNITQWGSNAVVTGGTNGSVGVGGLAATNTNAAGNPVLIGGSDYGGTPKAQNLKVDASGFVHVTLEASTGTSVVSGTVTANQGTNPWVTNVTQWGSQSVLTGGSNGSVGVGGLAATNAATVGNPVLIAGSDYGGTPKAQNLKVDASGFVHVTLEASTGTSVVSGTVTANQGTNPWVVSGTVGISGTVGVTQSTSPWVDNVTQWGSNAVVTGGTNGSVGVGGLASTNTNAVGNPVLIAGSDYGGTPKAQNLKVDSSGFVHVTLEASTGTSVVSVTGTVGVTQSTSPWVTNVTQWGSQNVLTGGSNGSVGVGGLAATNAATVGNPVLIAGSDYGGTPKAQNLKVDASGFVHVTLEASTGTSVVSGTVTANQGGAPWSQNLTQIAGTGIVTGGVNGSQGVGGLAATNTNAAGNPVLIAGSDYGGTPKAQNLKVDSSGFVHVTLEASTGTSVVSGTVTANQGGAPWSIVGNLTNNNAVPSTNNVGALVALAETGNQSYNGGDQVLLTTDTSGNALVRGAWDQTASGTLSAANANLTTGAATANSTVAIGLQGLKGLGWYIPSSSTLVATIIPQFSLDAGTTWQTGWFTVSTGGSQTSAGYVQTFTTVTGTAYEGTFLLVPGATNYRVTISALTSGTTTGTLKATSLPGNDQKVFGQYNSSAPTLATGGYDVFQLDSSGNLKVNITAQTLSNTNMNVAQWGGQNVVTGGTNGSVGVGGLAATNAATVGNPVLIAGSDYGGTPKAQNLKVDASGFVHVTLEASTGTSVVSGTVTANQGTSPWVTNVTQWGSNAVVTGGTNGSVGVGGLAATNTNAAGNPVLIGGSDYGGTPKAQNLKVDSSGFVHVTLEASTGTSVVSGTVTANQGGAPWSQNITQIAGTGIVTGGVNGSQGIGGLAATNTSAAGNPVLIAGSDYGGTPKAQNLKVDSSGFVHVTLEASTGTSVVSGTVTANQGTSPWVTNVTQWGSNAVVTGGTNGSVGVGGLAATNAATVGNPVLIAGSDYGGTAKAQNLKVDASGFVHVTLEASTGTSAVQPVGNASVLNGQVNVTTSSQTFSSNPLKTVKLRAFQNNAGVVYVGTPAVTTANGFPLWPGDSIDLAVANLNELAYIADQGTNTLAWLGTN